MPETPPPLPPARRSCLVPILVVLAVLALILGGLWWWYHRPITPVVLTPPERSALSAKLEVMENPAPEPGYQPGSKEIIITERELNGLINDNTDLGETVQLELATDAIHARVETDINPSAPLVGGKRLKAKARFFVTTTDGNPSLTLDDVTVWGVSLPNDWLGGMKGQDLLGDLLGKKSGGLAGVESIHIKPGQLVIRLRE